MYSLHNIHFKQPTPGRSQPGRSPSPPHSYVEPLSPSNVRPRPIEPSFNYPALGMKDVFGQQQAIRPSDPNETAQTRQPVEIRRSHHRKISSMDALADAALAMNPPMSHQSGWTHQRQEHPYNQNFVSLQESNEPAYKRAKTDTYTASPVVQGQIQSGSHAYQSEQDRRASDQMQRLELAALLVDFRSADSRAPPATTLPRQLWQDPQRPVSDSFVHAHPHTPMLPPSYTEQRPNSISNGSNGFGHYQHYVPPMQHGQHVRPASSFNHGSFPKHLRSESSTVGAPEMVGDASDSVRKSKKRSQKGSVSQSQDSASHPVHWASDTFPMFHASMSSSLPSPQQTHESNGQNSDTMSELSDEHIHATKRKQSQATSQAPRRVQQVHTPPEELDTSQHLAEAARLPPHALPPKRRGWPKGKPRGPSVMKGAVASKRPTARRRKPAASRVGAKQKLTRRHSFGVLDEALRSDKSIVTKPVSPRSHSVPPEISMVIRKGPTTRRRKVKAETSCAGCRVERKTATGLELDDWISCNGCKQWFHLDCAGFRNAVEVRDVDKYFCAACEEKHGKTTYVRKSRRAHTSVDYAELQKGVLKTSDESQEHHYIQPIKDGSFIFDPETFPRVRPELLTRDYFERGGFVEPVCIPAAWNPRPWGLDEQGEEVKQEEGEDNHDGVVQSTTRADAEGIDGESYEFDCVEDDGQDALDMVMPKALTVRKVCNLVGPMTPLDVIDVKTQNSGAKWNLSRWADYYESNAEDKPVRNVISLEVSHTKLGRLLRRPKIVRDIDLQDQVWPQEEVERGKWPKVQYYCLMSIADSYTDFHIDFGGSSVYYHLIKGKKTFFFIPPRAKHLKAYEEWNNNPQQNFTFLPDITKECYRVDLSEGDTMLIPSGWIHAVWTPETSLVIGGNFLTRMSFKNQFKVAEIEKNNETPQKFRYPYFQRLMWWTVIDYLEKDPMPEAVEQLFLDGKQYERALPIWREFDGEDAEQADRPGAHNARYYSEAELDGLPELLNFIFRSVLLSNGCLDGITPDKVKRVAAGIPVSKRHGGPLQLAKDFALWVAWKRGNENPPAWSHPDYSLPVQQKDDPASKKLSAKAVKDLERKKAIAAFAKQRGDRHAKRADKQNQPVMFDTDTMHNPAQPAVPMMQTHSFDQISTPPVINGLRQDVQASSFIPVEHYQGHYISTPKTSVLGPRRVACDSCRKRRIKCKHKDVVVQAPSDALSQQDQSGPSSGVTWPLGVAQQMDSAYGYMSYGVNIGHDMEATARAYANAGVPMELNDESLLGQVKRQEIISDKSEDRIERRVGTLMPLFAQDGVNVQMSGLPAT